MAMDTWGVARKPDAGEAEPAEPHPKRVALPPASAQAGHKGIVWLHASAIGIWLMVVVTLGALLLAGKNVPPMVVLIGVAAACGHGLFLATHLLLARSAAKRAKRASAGA
jgi:hypothetical protein